MPPVEMLKLLKYEQRLHPAVEAAEQSEMKKQCSASQQEAAKGLHPNRHTSTVHWASSGSVAEGILDLHLRLSSHINA